MSSTSVEDSSHIGLRYQYVRIKDLVYELLYLVVDRGGLRPLGRNRVYKSSEVSTSRSQPLVIFPAG